MEEYNPKKENIPYTICIVKPDIVAKDSAVQIIDFVQVKIGDIIKRLEDEKFTIINMLKKELSKEEVINLYYKYINDNFFDNMAKFLMNGDSLILMLTKDESNPIVELKKLLGHSDPSEAKKNAAQSLRALYGTDRMKNAFHGSDNQIDASKERDIFKFPIPQKVPEFKFDKFKITFDMLMKFIYPPNLEHPNVNARLDIFALYGPVLNHHSVDTCLCKTCGRLGKEYLQHVILSSIEDEKRKLGIISSKSGGTVATTKATSMLQTKLMIAPKRNIDEQVVLSSKFFKFKGILMLWNQLCDKCKEHCESYVHLASGREQQHLLTDLEIAELAYEINRKELYEILKIEKESTADVMIETIEIKEPNELQYNRDLIQILLSDLETDYYGRYNFQDMQNMILEDRRIRMNAWVTIHTGKPLKLYKNPKLLNKTIKPQERMDPKNLNFTLSRCIPLSYTIKSKDINQQPTTFEASLVDKKKLQPNEEKIVLFKLLHRNHINSTHHVNNIYLMRQNYNEGRNGGWNNYCTLKGMNKGSYVNHKQQKQ